MGYCWGEPDGRPLGRHGPGAPAQAEPARQARQGRQGASPVTSPLLELNGIVKRYGARTALDGISLQAREGELVALLGPNGAGKTTTVRIATGQLDPDAGWVRIAGIAVADDPVRAKALCGVAAQHLNLDRELTVAQNLDIHGRLYRMPKPARLEAMARLLEATGLAELRDTPCKSLSGGQQRRAVLARALMHGPRLLFLDEPTAGLDPEMRRTLWGLVGRIREQGATILLTTHYIEEAERLADRVVFLDRGRVACEGSPKALMAGLGSVAVDVLPQAAPLQAGQSGQDEIPLPETVCFKERAEALAFAQDKARQGFQTSLRAVRLEDAYFAVAAGAQGAQGAQGAPQGAQGGPAPGREGPAGRRL
ncbi:MAG: ABC transporter ATP-binding protein [Desulfovibrio sp.]|nr:ABC transporter ATP-binding protein [Desulfovibrio sp.]